MSLLLETPVVPWKLVINKTHGPNGSEVSPRWVPTGCRSAESANHPDVPQYVSESRDGGRHICSTPKRLGFVALTALTARKTERFLGSFSNRAPPPHMLLCGGCSDEWLSASCILAMIPSLAAAPGNAYPFSVHPSQITRTCQSEASSAYSD